MSEADVRAALKSMVVGEGGCLPIKYFSFLTINPAYDPSSFSQEIEDSEVAINTFKLIFEEMHKPGFDIVWNNTLVNIPRNSDKWCENHSKNCPFNLAGMKKAMSSVTHEDGSRDYCSEENVKWIMEYSESCGGIISFV